MTSHLEESTMKGTLATSGSLAEQLKEAGHGGDAVDHAFVHADVDDVGAVFDLLAGDADGFFELAFLDELGEFGRTGDVGALADHDEDAGLLGEGLRAGEAQAALVFGLVRSARSSCPRRSARVFPQAAGRTGAGACR